jgi:hypothetical protein
MTKENTSKGIEEFSNIITQQDPVRLYQTYHQFTTEHTTFQFPLSTHQERPPWVLTTPKH